MWTLLTVGEKPDNADIKTHRPAALQTTFFVKTATVWNHLDPRRLCSAVQGPSRGHTTPAGGQRAFPTPLY